MHWGFISAGLGMVTVMTVAAILIGANGGGAWLVAFFPFAAVASGAFMIAGREQQS